MEKSGVSKIDLKYKPKVEIECRKERMWVAGLGVDDELPQTLVHDGVEERQVMEAHRPPKQVFQDVPVQEHRA